MRTQKQFTNGLFDLTSPCLLSKIVGWVIGKHVDTSNNLLREGDIAVFQIGPLKAVFPVLTL